MKHKTQNLKLILLNSLIATTLASCATINDGLTTLNSGLTTANQILGAAAGTTSNNGKLSSSPVVSISTDQKNKITQGLVNSQKQYKGNISNAIAEASPNISKVISFIACYPGSHPEGYLAQYAAPNRSPFIALWLPMNRMRNYHPQSQCVSVSKFQGWSMPAANALKFEVIYLSDISGQSQRFSYEIVKQPSGEWLFTSAIGY